MAALVGSLSSKMGTAPMRLDDDTDRWDWLTLGVALMEVGTFSDPALLPAMLSLLRAEYGLLVLKNLGGLPSEDCWTLFPSVVPATRFPAVSPSRCKELYTFSLRVFPKGD